MPFLTKNVVQAFELKTTSLVRLCWEFCGFLATTCIKKNNNNSVNHCCWNTAQIKTRTQLQEIVAVFIPDKEKGIYCATTIIGSFPYIECIVSAVYVLKLGPARQLRCVPDIPKNKVQINIYKSFSRKGCYLHLELHQNRQIHLCDTHLNYNRDSRA